MNKLFLLIVIGFTMACEFPASGFDGDQQIIQKIKEGNRTWEKYFSEKDSKAMASMYTSDAILMPPDFDFQKGGGPIEEIFLMHFSYGAYGANLMERETIVDGNIAYNEGAFTFDIMANEKPLKVFGNYLSCWEKQKDGSWLINKHIWNLHR